MKDVHAKISYAEVIKNGGAISSLNRSDNVEAISKKEADSLIKGKKIAKKRPGEKATNTNARTSQRTTRKSKGGAGDNFEQFIMGDSWIDFGNKIVQSVDEEMKKLQE